jgi:hypothetical protein
MRVVEDAPGGVSGERAVRALTGASDAGIAEERSVVGSPKTIYSFLRCRDRRQTMAVPAFDRPTVYDGSKGVPDAGYGEGGKEPTDISNG